MGCTRYDAGESQLQDGNLTEGPPAQVLRQTAVEKRQRDRYFANWCENIAKAIQVSREEDILSRELRRVYLDGHDPLAVHFYREYFLRKLTKQPSTIHINAKGGVTKRIGYVVLAEQQGGKSYPLGQMSESHSAPLISHFLSQLSQDYKVVTGKSFKPRHIAYDFFYGQWYTRLLGESRKRTV